MAILIGEPMLADRVVSLLHECRGVRVVDADNGDAEVVLTDTLPDHETGRLVIVISDRMDAIAALRAGAAGVLASSATSAQLRAAIDAVIQGLSIIPGDLRDVLEDDPPEEEATSAAAGIAIALTARELEVLGLIAAGASNKMIARKLQISVHTAKFHVASILAKLDATGRTDAVAQAARLGLLML